MNKEKINILGYERVSTENQCDNGLGLEIQGEAIEKYAKENWYNLIKIFSEKGVSWALENRPALGEMIRYLEENKGTVDKVVFLRLDRLARDLLIQENLIDEFQKLKVQPVSIDEKDLCSSDPSRILFRQMKWAISQYEKSMITIRLSSWRKKKVETLKNYWGGKAPYWYEIVNWKFKAVDNQIKIVKEIHKLRRKPKKWKKLSYEKIKQIINSKYSDIKRFSTATIHYIANNSFYKWNVGYSSINVFNSEFKII